MTRKHFQLIAGILKKVKPVEDDSGQWRAIIKETIVMLKSTNPRFDSIRFKTACGYND